MKKIPALIFLYLIGLSSAWAQINNDLVVFCNDGERFTLILNGQRYNETPQTSVKATDLKFTSYMMKVIFENPRIKEYNTKLTFFDTNKECVFALVKQSKKKYTTQYVSSSDIIPMPPQQQVTNPAPVNNNTSTNTTNNTSQQQKDQASIKLGNVGINVGGNGIQLKTKEGSVNVNPTGHGGNISVKEGNNSVNLNRPVKTGCSGPLTYEKFSEVRGQVSSAANDTEKLNTGKQILKNNCFTTAEIKEITALFTEEVNRLEFAKLAYAHTSDPGNYHQVKDSFSQEETRKELQKFIASQR